MKVESKSAFSASSARVIALRIENPYSILRQIANLPQQSKSAFSAFSARVIAFRIENPYSILRQSANLPQRRGFRLPSFSPQQTVNCQLSTVIKDFSDSGF